ncbi:MAG: hypothetical protein K2M17_02370 [Bacilli bacterium]|nr:hypothetical protein [Bacilli bacterium]
MEKTIFEVLADCEKAVKVIKLHNRIIQLQKTAAKVARELKSVNQIAMANEAFRLYHEYGKAALRASSLANKILDRIFEVDESLALKLDEYLQD